MRIVVSTIPEGGLEQQLVVPVVTGDEARPDIANVFIRIFRIGKKVLIDGSISISVTMRCSRCLGEFSRKYDINFKDEYNPTEEVISDSDYRLTNSEMDLSYYENDEIDIGELVKEQVLLEIPMKPLCGEDCKGICPKCGKNLNEGSCSCEGEGVDPRLAPLEKFKELMKDRKE